MRVHKARLVDGDDDIGVGHDVKSGASGNPIDCRDDRLEESDVPSGEKLRPAYHFAPQRTRTHVAVSVLALLLERVAERACGNTWRNIRDDVKRIKLAQLSGPVGKLWQVNNPGPDVANRLKSLEIPHPPPILGLA